MRCRFGVVLLLWLFFSVSSWAQAGPSSPAPGPAGSYGISATELARLIEISKRLDELNVKLQSELAASKANSVGLLTELSALKPELEASRSEAAALRSDSEALRTELEELRPRLAASLTDSTALREALARAESSSESLQRSWTEFEAEALRRFRALELQRNAAAVAAAVGWVVAVLALIF